MLSEMWNFIKVGFKGRLLLSFTVVTCFSFFLSMPNLIVKIIFLTGFAISSAAYMGIFIQKFLPELRFSFDKKSEYLIPAPIEIAELSKAIGATIKEVKLRVKMNNAFVRGKTLVLGMELLNRLDPLECQAVVAHEIGHVKERHRIILVLVGVSVLLLPSFSWSIYSLPIVISPIFTQGSIMIMKEVALFAFFMVALIPISWYLELRSDRIAAEFVGKQHIASALLKLSKNIDEPSETHPSIADRIKYIDEMGKGN
jgi:Zn-dependent protease with chaperone function